MRRVLLGGWVDITLSRYLYMGIVGSQIRIYPYRYRIRVYLRDPRGIPGTIGGVPLVPRVPRPEAPRVLGLGMLKK